MTNDGRLSQSNYHVTSQLADIIQVVRAQFELAEYQIHLLRPYLTGSYRLISKLLRCVSMVSCHLLKHSASYLPSAHSNPEPSIRLRCKRFAFNQNQMNSSSLYYAVVVVDVFHQDAITRRFRAIQHLEFIGSTTDLGILIP